MGGGGGGGEGRRGGLPSGRGGGGGTLHEMGGCNPTPLNPVSAHGALCSPTIMYVTELLQVSNIEILDTCRSHT